MPRAHTGIQLQPRVGGRGFRIRTKQFWMSVPRRPLSRLIRSAPVQVGASVVLAGAGLYALDALLAAALRDTLQELPSPPQADTPLLPHETHIQYQPAKRKAAVLEAATPGFAAQPLLRQQPPAGQSHCVPGLRALHESVSEGEASAPVEAEEATGELAAPEAPSLEAEVVSSSPSRAVDLASACSKDVQSLRALLEQRGIKLAGWTRFQDSGAELIRFAISQGLFRAQNAEARQQALQAAADAIAETAAWMQTHQFLSADELGLLGHLVHWKGQDGSQRPVLQIRLGQALRECKAAAAADHVAEAIITHTDYAVRSLLSSDRDKPEQMVVVMDCRGATAFQASKLVRLMRNVGLTLNRYYPGRLYQLFFVEPPTVMKWPIQAAKPLLHPNTGNKIHICAANDPALPFPI